MHEPSSLRRLMREWIVVRYTAALEHGDLDTLSAIMERAQHDNILQLMLLEIHEVPDEESLLALMNDKDIDMETKTGTARSMPESEPDRQPRQPRRRALWLNTLAAAVLICLLGGGFLGIRYLSSPHTAQTGNKGKPAATTAVGRNGWCVVTTPALAASVSYPQLSAISGDAANDIWAVGSSGLGLGQPTQSLIEHWNGHSWTNVPIPNTNGATNVLSGVQAIAPNDAWAVGSTQLPPPSGNGPMTWTGLPQQAGTHSEPYAAFSGGPGNPRILLEHWDGQKWSVVAFPHLATWGSDNLDSISAISANDIWVAGFFEDRTGLASNDRTPGTYMPLLAHWDGTQWKVISRSVFPQNFEFNLVKAISDNDIWVASSLYGDDTGNSTNPLLHWNGSQWQTISAGPAGFTLNSLSVVSANDIWAVGDNGTDPFVTHWNGSQWSTVNLPDTHPQQATDGSSVSLNSVFAISSNDVWAVGDAVDHTGTYYQVVVHWDGQQWKVLPPDLKDDQGQLLGVTVIAGKIWSVGIGYTNGYQEVPTTLSESSCH